ncbi:MAG TPA: apolipoprotein N-acyltransferase [Planctomycetota bacterium]|nr:apolipoprotein N-acyltransferase [Planctomycetota bacterium]
MTASTAQARDAGASAAGPSRFLPFAAAFATAAAWAACFHPFRAPWLAWVALVPWLLYDLGPGAAAGRRRTIAWVAARYVVHLASLWWTTTCAPPLAFLVPLLGVPFSWLEARLMALGRDRLPAWIAYPAAVVLVELLRDHALKGLTWSSLGYALDVWPEALALAAVGRVHLLSWVVLAANVLIAEAWRRRGVRAAPARRAAALGAILVATHVAGALARPGDFEPGPRAAGLQPNIPQYDRNATQARRGPTAGLGESRRPGLYEQLRRHADLLEAVDADALDLLVFAETSFPAVREPTTLADLLRMSPRPEARPALRYGDVVLRRPGAKTVLGLARQVRARPGSTLPDADGDGFHEWNTAWVLDGGAPTDVIYEKRELAPFGEFLPMGPGAPLYDTVAGLARRALGHVPDMIPGARGVLFEAPSAAGPRRGAINICFEAVFPRYFREAVRDGADFTVNISNDAWFLDSAELDLVDQAIRWRAAECGRAVFRVSNSGISTLVGPDGARLAVVEGVDGDRKEVAGVLLGEIPVHRGLTPYARWGDAPWLAVAAAYAAALFVRRRRPDGAD